MGWIRNLEPLASDGEQFAIEYEPGSTMPAQLHQSQLFETCSHGKIKTGRRAGRSLPGEA